MKPLGIMLIMLLIFVLIFVFLRLITIIKVKMDSEEISIPLKYIKNRYKLKVRERRSKRLRLYIDLVNTIAIIVPIYIVLFINLKISKVFIYGSSLIIFMIILLSGYNLIGVIEKRKEEK